MRRGPQSRSPVRLGKILPLLSVVALTAIFVAILIVGRHLRVQSALVGKIAPANEFVALADPRTAFSLADYRGQKIIVNFFASWCAPCRAEHPNLMALSRDPRVRLIGVLYKDEAAKGSQFLAELGNPFAQVGLDRDGQIGLAFGLTGVPESFAVDETGRVVGHFAGPLDAARAQMLYGALHADRTPNR